MWDGVSRRVMLPVGSVNTKAHGTLPRPTQSNQARFTTAGSSTHCIQSGEMCCISVCAQATQTGPQTLVGVFDKGQLGVPGRRRDRC